MAARSYKAVIIRALRESPVLSRADLSLATGLSPAVVHATVRELTTADWVREIGLASSHSGRPRVQLALNPDRSWAVGVHIRVSSYTLALIDFGGRVRSARNFPLPADDVTELAPAMAQQARAMAAEAGLVWEEAGGVGIAIPGIWDGERGVIVSIPNLPRWSGLGLSDLFRRAFARPVQIENDANAGAMGELVLGAGRGLQHMAYIYTDEGIGAGIVTGGELVLGTGQAAGEIGHVKVTLDPVPCRCGNTGCLEAVGSLLALRRYLGEGLTLEAALDRIAGFLAVAVADLVNLLAPEAVVLGGPMLEQYPQIWAAVAEYSRQNLLEFLRHQVQFVPAALGTRAVVTGAVLPVFDRLFTMRRAPG